MKDGHILTDADMDLAVTRGLFTRLTPVVYGGRRVDIVEAARKVIGRGIKDIPTLVFQFDLTLYDVAVSEDTDDMIPDEVLLVLESLGGQ